MTEEAASTPQVGILFALAEEAAPFLRRVRLSDTERVRERGVYPAVFPPKTTTDVPIRLSVGISGTGRRQAAGVAADLLDDPASCPRILVVCGFAGGLAASVGAGDLVLATSVLHSADSGLQTETPDPTLTALAQTLVLPGVALHSGPLLTQDRIVTTAREKRAIAHSSEALALDMETLGAVGVARDRGVPWLAVRAVSDSVNDDFPLDFNQIADANGDVDRGRVVRAALLRPQSIPGLIRLGRRSALAAKNLTLFLEALLRVLPKE